MENLELKMCRRKPKDFLKIVAIILFVQITTANCGGNHFDQSSQSIFSRLIFGAHQKKGPTNIRGGINFAVSGNTFYDPPHYHDDHHYDDNEPEGSVTHPKKSSYRSRLAQTKQRLRGAHPIPPPATRTTHLDQQPAFSSALANYQLENMALDYFTRQYQNGETLLQPGTPLYLVRYKNPDQKKNVNHKRRQGNIIQRNRTITLPLPYLTFDLEKTQIESSNEGQGQAAVVNEPSFFSKLTSYIMTFMPKPVSNDNKYDSQGQSSSYLPQNEGLDYRPHNQIHLGDLSGGRRRSFDV